MLLLDFGFKQVGRWTLSKHASVPHLAHLHGINFELDAAVGTKRNAVYAFTFSGTPCYVGMSNAKGGLRSRFESYRYGNSLIRDTDNRIKKAITDHLCENGEVAIWFAEPIAELQMPNNVTLRLPGYKLLEEYVIEKLHPKFNVHGFETPL